MFDLLPFSFSLLAWELAQLAPLGPSFVFEPLAEYNNGAITHCQ